MEAAADPTHPILIENEFQASRVTKECPPVLRNLIESQSEGLRRIVVSVVVGRNDANKLNAIRIVGAKHNERTANETLESVIDALMRIVSSHIEAEGQGATMRIVCHVVDRAGKSSRGQGKDLPFKGIYDTPSATSERESANPEHYEMLRYLASQNRHTLNLMGECRQLVTTVGTAFKSSVAYTETVVGRLADALVREREATDAKAEAQADTIKASGEHEIELAKLKQRGELLELMSPLMGQATSQIGVKAAEALGSGKAGAAKASNPLAIGSPPTPASPTKTKTKTKKKKKTTTETTETTSAEDAEDARIEALKGAHPNLYSVIKLRRSLTDDQEPKVREALGAAAWDALEKAASSTSDEAAISALVVMVDEAPKESTGELLAILDGKQQGVIGTLRFAVMQRTKAL